VSCSDFSPDPVRAGCRRDPDDAFRRCPSAWRLVCFDEDPRDAPAAARRPPRPERACEGRASGAGLGASRRSARRSGSRFGLGLGFSSTVSQYGHSAQRGSTGLPHDGHGSLSRARQLGQRR
jgi:hypothetical protein